MVEREAEYNDDDRHRLLGLARYRVGVCRDCGYHRSLYDEDGNVFNVEDEVCPGCKVLDHWNRQRGHEEHEHYKDASPGGARPGDGRRTFLTLTRGGEGDPTLDEPEGGD